MSKPIRLCALLLACFLFFSACTGKNTEITVFYTTDTHGHLTPNHPGDTVNTIDLAQIASLKKGTPNALLLDSGDFLHGTILANLSKGADIILLMKQSGYDAAAIGNHEFSHGSKALKERSAEADEFPELTLLSANITGMDNRLVFRPATSIRTGEQNICIVGITTPESKTEAAPEAVKGLNFLHPKAALEAQLEFLRTQDCNAVIALTHLGSSRAEPYTSLELAGDVDGVDVILDGHSHVVLEEKVGATLVLSSGSYQRHLGKLTLTFNKLGELTKTANALLTPADLTGTTRDPVVSETLARMQAEANKHSATQIGYIDHPLSGERALVSTRQCGLGSLVADSYRAAYQADIALVNSGGIRNGLPQGEISLLDVLNVLAFDNSMVLLEVSGKEIYELLEHSVSKLPDASGGFSQVSGLVVYADISKAPGARIITATLEDGTRIQPEQQYSLACNNFMAAGGDGYPILADKNKLASHLGEVEALSRFITENNLSAYPGGVADRFVLQNEK